MTTFEPLHRRTLADQICAQLREAITNGTYGPGDALPAERNLAELFGVSRVAIREALVILQGEGLIERAHGKASRVAMQPSAAPASREVINLPDDPSAASVHDVKQARVLLEVDMVRSVAQKLDAAGARTLRAALKANRDAISDSAAFHATDMALHGAIAALSNNALYAAMSREMLAWLTRFQHEAVHLKGSDMLSYREHAAIVERILAKDPDGAAQAMVDHLLRTHEGYKLLEEGSPRQPAAAGKTARR
jgi:DNA-binding FadR family transcriptional regulator